TNVPPQHFCDHGLQTRAGTGVTFRKGAKIGVKCRTPVPRFRKMPALAKIPFVMLTGKSDKHTVHASLKAGANDFIAKPFDRATLLTKLDKLLG
ncbi:response regulator, partial [Thauera aromatica]|uniref:response regulator n=1 Tax=Thauera aromatica TaxID=59405 RepID=UPI001FFC7190